MSNKQLRDAVRAEPFRPFRVHMTLGRDFVVRHPEFVQVIEGYRTFVFTDVERGTHRIVDLLHVGELEFDLPEDGPEVPDPPPEPAASGA